MDETLMSSREWLHEIFHSLNDVAWSANAIAWQTLFLTPSAETVYGYPVAEFFHNPHLWRSLIHDDDRDRVENLIPTLFSTDKLDLEYRIVRASGEIRWLYHRLRVIRDAQGQALRIDGMATDITEHQQAEAAIRESEKLFHATCEQAMAVIEDISDVYKELRLRKQAEEALHKSEERFRNLVETTSDWVWEVDEDLVYTYVSPKVRDILGYAPYEIQGKTPCDLMTFRERHRMANFFGQLLAVKEPFSRLESTEIHKDGHRVVMETSGVPLFDGEGRFCGYRGITRDITERKRMEEALKESQQKYQTLFEILPIGISITDEVGNILEANPASEEILGLSIAEQTQRQHDAPQWFMIRPDCTPLPISEFPNVKALTQKRVIKNFEAGLVQPNGEIAWLSVTAAPIPLPGYGVAIAYTDISDVYGELRLRQQAEETLRLQAERERFMGTMLERIRQSLQLDEILNTTVEEVRQLLQNDRVLLFKLCNDRVGRVVTESVAPGLPSTTGMEFPDEVFPDECYQYYCHGLPRIVPDIAHDDFAPCLNEFMQDLGVKSKLVIPILRSNQPGEKTNGYSLNAGISCQAAINDLATPATPQTSLWGVMTAHDCSGNRQWQQWEIDLLSSLATQIGIAIQQSELYLQLEAQLTELQVAEVALQQAKEVAVSEAARSAVANRAKSEFLANMSHELRTPLNGILGYAQILKKDTNLTGQQQNSLSIIHQCGEQLLTLIDDILDLSKIEAQKMELYPTEFHLPNFLQSVADLFQMRAQAKDIFFTYQILPPPPEGVIGDSKRLRQVLCNLLSNAVKFTDNGGVRFTVSYVERETEDWKKTQRYRDMEQFSPLPKTKIRFQIEDTGIGIAPNQLAEIFLPFHQVSDFAHALEGTGLGLAISQKLVQMMGSEINVRSTLNQGSVFWFDLDLPPVGGCNEFRPSSDRLIIGYRGGKRQVLVVDDHPVNRSMLRELLELVGFDVIEAVDGQDGLNKALELQPDVILMDLLMPVLDGLETTRRLRKLPQIQDVVIIALSANVFEITQHESLAAGCHDFLSKPVQTERLLDAIAKHLSLEWIYEEELCNTKAEPNVHHAPLVLPPYSAIAALSELIKMGDIAGILDQAEQLEKLDDKLVPFATQIHQLAKSFNMKQLREIIQQYLADGQ
jgi:PAS domain S-box-containing protein